MSSSARPPESLVQLARRLGDPTLGLAILAEGNVSCEEDGVIWVTRSGACLGTCAPQDFVAVDGNRLVDAMRNQEVDAREARSLLDEAVIIPENGGHPSTEAWMHAVLLTQTPARFVAHTHPEALLSILTLNDADDFARRRLFPDEVVLCGPASLFVPYTMPGLPLAREIDARVRAWRGRLKCLWLRNHGLIALGETAADALATTLMAAKAARVLLGALASGKEIQFLQPGEVEVLEGWEDEAARQRLLADSNLSELN